jgi:CheY-like chemotaxis protein
LISFLLEWAESLERVDSATFLRVSPEGTQYQHIWRQLDGKISSNQFQPLASSTWNESLQAKIPSIDSQGPTLLSLKPLEAPYKDRALLPISWGEELLGGLVLSSVTEQGFSAWDKEALTLLSGLVGQRLHTDRKEQELQNQLLSWEQKNRFTPPLLQGVLQLSHATLAETETRLTCVLHNLDTVQGYSRRLLQLIKFCNDEIRINAGGESQEKVEAKAKRLQLPLIESDIDLLLSDCNDALARIRFFLNDLASLEGTEEAEEQVDLLELLQSMTSVVSASRLVKWDFQRNEHEIPALFGRSQDLRQAFLLLLLSIEQQLSSEEEPARIHVRMEDLDDELSLALSFPVESEEGESAEFVLEGEEFIRRILEEHQASLGISIHAQSCTLRLSFPVMFDYNEDTNENLTQGGALELPAIPDSFDWNAMVESEAPSEPPAASTRQSAALVSGKLLVLSEDSLYLRSLKRALSHQHEVFTTNQLSKALGLLDAHPDLNLILCDLQDKATSTLELTEHLGQYAPHLFGRVALLVGRRLGAEAAELAERLETMSCPRNALYQAVEEFIQQRIAPPQ